MAVIIDAEIETRSAKAVMILCAASAPTRQTFFNYPRVSLLIKSSLTTPTA